MKNRIHVTGRSGHKEKQFTAKDEGRKEKQEKLEE
jgi:hypothetical protein